MEINLAGLPFSWWGALAVTALSIPLAIGFMQFMSWEARRDRERLNKWREESGWANGRRMEEEENAPDR